MVGQAFETLFISEVSSSKLSFHCAILSLVAMSFPRKVGCWSRTLPNPSGSGVAATIAPDNQGDALGEMIEVITIPIHNVFLFTIWS